MMIGICDTSTTEHAMMIPYMSCALSPKKSSPAWGEQFQAGLNIGGNETDSRALGRRHAAARAYAVSRVGTSFLMKRKLQCRGAVPDPRHVSPSSGQHAANPLGSRAADQRKAPPQDIGRG
jgi:hypothetical protein